VATYASNRQDAMSVTWYRADGQSTPAVLLDWARELYHPIRVRAFECYSWQIAKLAGLALWERLTGSFRNRTTCRRAVFWGGCARLRDRWRFAVSRSSKSVPRLKYNNCLYRCLTDRSRSPQSSVSKLPIEIRHALLPLPALARSRNGAGQRKIPKAAARLASFRTVGEKFFACVDERMSFRLLPSLLK
jgi:hypothetical protein